MPRSDTSAFAPRGAEGALVQDDVAMRLQLHAPLHVRGREEPAAVRVLEGHGDGVALVQAHDLRRDLHGPVAVGHLGE
eukprot:3746853-Lingulodinium_polyedra.AAC.1